MPNLPPTDRPRRHRGGRRAAAQREAARRRNAAAAAERQAAPEPTRPRRSRWPVRCHRCSELVDKADATWIAEPPLLSVPVHAGCRRVDDETGDRVVIEAKRSPRPRRGPQGEEDGR